MSGENSEDRFPAVVGVRVDLTVHHLGVNILGSDIVSDELKEREGKDGTNGIAGFGDHRVVNVLVDKLFAETNNRGFQRKGVDLVIARDGDVIGEITFTVTFEERLGSRQKVGDNVAVVASGPGDVGALRSDNGGNHVTQQVVEFGNEIGVGKAVGRDNVIQLAQIKHVAENVLLAGIGFDRGRKTALGAFRGEDHVGRAAKSKDGGRIVKIVADDFRRFLTLLVKNVVALVVLNISLDSLISGQSNTELAHDKLLELRVGKRNKDVVPRILQNGLDRIVERTAADVDEIGEFIGDVVVGLFGKPLFSHVEHVVDALLNHGVDGGGIAVGTINAVDLFVKKVFDKFGRVKVIVELVTEHTGKGGADVKRAVTIGREQSSVVIQEVDDGIEHVKIGLAGRGSSAAVGGKVTVGVNVQRRERNVLEVAGDRRNGVPDRTVVDLGKRIKSLINAGIVDRNIDDRHLDRGSVHFHQHSVNFIERDRRQLSRREDRLVDAVVRGDVVVLVLAVCRIRTEGERGAYHEHGKENTEDALRVSHVVHLHSDLRFLALFPIGRSRSERRTGTIFVRTFLLNDLPQKPNLPFKRMVPKRWPAEHLSEKSRPVFDGGLLVEAMVN